MVIAPVGVAAPLSWTNCLPTDTTSLMAALTDGTAAVLTDRRAPDIVASAGEVDGELTVFALRTVRIVVSPPGALWAAAVSESMWTAVGVAFDDLLAAAGLLVLLLDDGSELGAPTFTDVM